jgi:protein-disulfide isomerase
MKTNRKTIPAILVTLLIIVTLIVIAPLIFRPTPSATTDVAPMDASPALGPADAPVTIIMYGDFGCSTCRYWYNLGVLKQLRAKYGDQMRFVWRDFPVITALSPKAAEAGQCAQEQGKFWEFHDAIYEHQGVIAAADLEKYAAEVWLDMEQFKECVSSGRYQQRVNAEEQEAFGRGFKATPGFLINGEPLFGPQALSAFEAIIDPLLAAKK